MLACIFKQTGAGYDKPRSLIGTIKYHQYLKYYHQYETIIAVASSHYGTDSFGSVWYHNDAYSGNLSKN